MQRGKGGDAVVEYISVLARQSAGGMAQAWQNWSWTDVGPLHLLLVFVVLLILWVLVKR